MKLHLIRHTITSVPSGICYGFSDVSLADTKDIGIVIQKLGNLSNPVVYSSPLTRCRLLAEQITKDVKYDDRLKELNFGDWELKAWDAIRDQTDAWMNDFIHTKCSGGESFLDLAERVLFMVNELWLANHKDVIIVTHGGVIRVILSVINGIPFRKCFSMEVSYGQIIDVEVGAKLSINPEIQK